MTSSFLKPTADDDAVEAEAEAEAASEIVVVADDERHA